MTSYLEDIHKCYKNEDVFIEQVKLFIATESIWQPLAPILGKVYSIIKEALLVSLADEIHNNFQKEVLLNACKCILADMDVVTDSNVYLYSYAKIFTDDSNNVTGIEFENTERVDVINGMVFEIISI